MTGTMVGFFIDFVDFFLKSLSDVPLEISLGSAVLLTFIWVTNEIFGKLSLWRIVLVTVWGMVLLDTFVAPVRGMSKEQLWLVVLGVGGAATILERALLSPMWHKFVRRKKAHARCPQCGSELGDKPQ